MRGLAMRCPRCHHENPTTQKFCGECAPAWPLVVHRVGHPILQARSSAANAEWDSASSVRLQCMGLRSPTHLGTSRRRSLPPAERKQVTVLFADLDGSMELLADRDPEVARMLLNPAPEHTKDAVLRSLGTS